MVLNQTTKYGLIFAGGLILGALGAVALAKGKKAGGIKPLASSLLSAGLDVKDKVMTGIDGVREELADVVAASPSLFWAIRILGALYLTYLAVMSWTHPTAGSASATKETADSVLFRRGILMNVTNPKVQIFFLAFFPQFVTRGASSLQTACEMTVLGVTFMIVTLLVFSLIAFCAGSVAEKLRTPRVQFYLNRTAAVIFACLAAGTLLS